MNKLKLLRLMRGLSQDDICHRTGLKQATYSLTERGYRKPTQEELEALGQVLDYPPKKLTEEFSMDDR